MSLQTDIKTAIRMAPKHQEGFSYICLSDAPDAETWLCKHRDHGGYAFTITITSRNIFVGGDIDEIAYRVGSRYGLAFLAEEGASGYAREKLAACSRNQTVLDFDAIILYAIDHFWDVLSDYHDDLEVPRESRLDGESNEDYIKRSVASIYDAWDDPDQSHKNELNHLVDLLNIDCEDADVYVSDEMSHQDIVDAFADMGMTDSWELGLHRPAYSVIATMEDAAYAARKILEIKAAKAAGQQQIAEATGQV